MVSPDVLLDWTLAPDATTISSARSMVDDLAGRVLGDADAGWRLAMATHELLDNARKYGIDGTARFHLAISRRGEEKVARVRVASRAAHGHLETLEHLVASIRAADDHWAFYLDAMRATALRTEGSGLGLARIRAEADMKLRLDLEGADGVTIEAELVIEESGP